MQPSSTKRTLLLRWRPAWGTVPRWTAWWEKLGVWRVGGCVLIGLQFLWRCSAFSASRQKPKRRWGGGETKVTEVLKLLVLQVWVSDPLRWVQGQEVCFVFAHSDHNYKLANVRLFTICHNSWFSTPLLRFCSKMFSSLWCHANNCTTFTLMYTRRLRTLSPFTWCGS